MGRKRKGFVNLSKPLSGQPLLEEPVLPGKGVADDGIEVVVARRPGQRLADAVGGRSTSACMRQTCLREL